MDSEAYEGLVDVVIIGGGPAGLSAGLWLGRFLHRVVLVDDASPRNWSTLGINGFLGLPHVRPTELRERGRAECRRYGVRLVDDSVMDIQPPDDDDGPYTIHMAHHSTVRAHRVLLAYGRRDLWPEIPGLEAAFGRTVHHCPDCDGPEARNQKVVAVGTGRRGMGLALALTTWIRNVILCTNGAPPDLTEAQLNQLAKLEITVLDASVLRAIVEHDQLCAIELDVGTDEPMRIDCDRLFFRIAQPPADDLARKLGCEVDDEGAVVVSDSFATSVRSVFAAGDLTPGPQLAMVAAAEGMLAGLAIHKTLLPDERRVH